MLKDFKTILNQKIFLVLFSLVILICLFIVLGLYFYFSLKPVNSSNNALVSFNVYKGESVNAITNDLYQNNLIRSPLAFKILAIILGKFSQFKPGTYNFSQSLSDYQIIQDLIKGNVREEEVVIPEGTNIFGIDEILSDNGIIKPGSLIKYWQDVLKSSGWNFEGYLFPDTYNFFIDSKVQDVVSKMLDNFNLKALPLLTRNQFSFIQPSSTLSVSSEQKFLTAQIDKNMLDNLIIASLIEKEADDYYDRQLIAGIIKKRLALNMPLQVDATICYIKDMISETSTGNCYPITKNDLNLNSPYNTYLNKGLPPAPISNPGTSSIIAAINSVSSSYLYYLSDPKTKQIIYSKNYAEQLNNEFKYLNAN